GLRLEMIQLVDGLRKEHGITVLMAIHAPEDASAVADLAAFIDEGRVVALGPPAEVLRPGYLPAIDRYFRRS
ncbi:MAG: thiamine ABC transporter ATP-binding protein, partial [Alphaproteobacteria bacterium]